MGSLWRKEGYKGGLEEKRREEKKKRKRKEVLSVYLVYEITANMHEERKDILGASTTRLPHATAHTIIPPTAAPIGSPRV